MSRTLEQLITDIIDSLSTDYHADDEKYRAMAKEYVTFCKKFNEEVEECRRLLERNMIAEALQRAESDTHSLFNQAQQLDFIGLNDFLELFSIYGWEAPPELRLDILAKISNLSINCNELAPLLDAYRKIARGDDNMQKIILLRRIAKLDQDKQEWVTTLRALEEKQLISLSEEAKNAIIQNNYPQLNAILQILTSPDWTIKPHEAIVKKIEKVLTSHRFREFQKLSEKHAEIISEAYGSYDFENLEKSLQKWEKLLAEYGFEPTEHLALQVNEAAKYYLEQKERNEAQKKINDNIEQIRKGLERETSLEVLEKIYTQLLSLNGTLPDELKQKFYAYKNSIEEVQRRKKVLKVTLFTSIVIVLLGAVALICYISVMKSIENKWIVRISTALEQQPADAALCLLGELKQAYPAIHQRSSISALADKAKSKKDAEVARSIEFQSIAKRFWDRIKDFEVNRRLLLGDKIKASCLVETKEDRAAYKQMDDAFNQQMTEYVNRQNKKYYDIAELIRAQRKAFFIGLEESNLTAAEKALNNAIELRDSLDNLRDVSPVTKADNNRIVDGVSELKVKLNLCKEQLRKKDELLANIYAPTSFQSLQNKINEFISSFPDAPQTMDFKNYLMSGINDINKNFSTNTEKTLAQDFFFTADANMLKTINENSNALLKKSTETLQNILDEELKNSTYAIIFESHDGKNYYDFYYRGHTVVVLPQEIRVDVLANEAGAINRLTIKKNPNTPNDYIVSFANKSFSARLVFPSSIEKMVDGSLATHVIVCQELLEAIKAANAGNCEEVLVNAISTTLKKQNIAPYLQLRIIKILLTMLKENAPQNKSYIALGNHIDALSLQIPQTYNWLQAFQTQDLATTTKIAAGLKSAENITLLPENAFMRDLYTVALARKIIPIGFVGKTNKGQELILFRDTPPAGEVWSFSAKDQKFNWVGMYSEKKLSIQQGVNVDWQILFTPTDAKSTAVLMSDVKKNAQKSSISEIMWPKSWPNINLQGIK